MHFDDLAKQVGDALLRRQWRVSTAESCTGGGVAYALTSVSGSSAWFHCGWIIYSLDAKIDQLGVDPAILSQYGSVSEQTVKSLLQGALRQNYGECVIAVSGIAGPDGGTPTKPVGTVWIGWATSHAMRVRLFQFNADREGVRQAAVQNALRGLLDFLAEHHAVDQG